MDFVFSNVYLPYPNQLKRSDWVIIRQMADHIVKERGFQLAQACVIAYMEYFNIKYEDVN